jgi:hypothetical protein
LEKADEDQAKAQLSQAVPAAIRLAVFVRVVVRSERGVRTAAGQLDKSLSKL